jgi:putative membrane protein
MKAHLIGALALGLATAAAAQTPAPAEFVAKAGASDKFEIETARLMVSSHNAMVKRFATQMITDHTTSTKLITAAAKADDVRISEPSLSVGQRADITAIKAVPEGKTRDDLYVKQQRKAHEDALALMQAYASSGSGAHLKATAAKIVPVVEKHQAMLTRM